MYHETMSYYVEKGMSSNRMDYETMSYYLEKGMSIREWIMKTCLTM